MFIVDLNSGDYVLPKIGQVSFDSENIPEYVTGFNVPMSAEAEMSFECDINVPVFAKLVGLDLSNGSDWTGARAASITFKSPYQVQKRRHKKKRINKKWAKRYGYKTMFKTYQLNDVQFEQNEEALNIIGSNMEFIILR